MSLLSKINITILLEYLVETRTINNLLSKKIKKETNKF